MSWITSILAQGTEHGFTVLKLSAVLYVFYLISLGIYNRYFHKLRHFPGPFWASITPLWYWKRVRWEQAEDVSYTLHEKYGDLVRISPNHLAVGSAAAVETIFMPKNGKIWKKGDFYDGFDPHVDRARTDGFSQRDEVKHGERRRIVAPLYTQGSVLQYEPCVDRLIDLFYSKMEQFSQTQETVDMSIWFKRYTFDVIGEMYYGYKEGFGMVREGRDYQNWIHLMVIPLWFPASHFSLILSCSLLLIVWNEERYTNHITIGCDAQRWSFDDLLSPRLPNDLHGLATVMERRQRCCDWNACPGERC